MYGLLEQFASDLVFHSRLVVRCGFQWLSAEDPLVEGEPVLDFVGFGVNRHPESLRKVTLTHRSSGQFLDDMFEINVESGLDLIQMGVQFGAHPFNLGVGLSPYIGEHLSLFAAEYHRVGQSLSAQVGASRVVRVVHS